MSQNTAYLFIDFINDIVHPDGKIAGKGYASFDSEFGALDRTAQLLTFARAQKDLVIHVRVGFSDGYSEHPGNSPLFGAAKKYGAFQLGAWGTEFHETVIPIAGEAIVTKHRVSAFYGTPLDLMFRNNGVTHVVIAGCATDMAVQAAARDAHDRDYLVTVVGDCCVAANRDDHDDALRMMSKIGRVEDLSNLLHSRAA